MTTTHKITSARKREIAEHYIRELDQHMQDLKSGRAIRTLDIKDLAEKLFIHPRHLSNTLHEVLGKSPCDLYEDRLITIAKELILESDESIANIARDLNFDPSNFNKFFKRFAGGITPKQFRDAHRSKN